MLAPVMTMREGARIYAPDGALLAEGDVLEQPGLVRALELIRDEGAGSVYEGTIAAELLALVAERGGAITREPTYAGTRPSGEGRHASPSPDGASSRAPGSRTCRRRSRATTRRDGRPHSWRRCAPQTGNGHTTNLTVVDAEGNACVLTTSLGLGSGDWLPGARPASEQHARGGRPDPQGRSSRASGCRA